MDLLDLRFNVVKNCSNVVTIQPSSQASHESELTVPLSELLDKSPLFSTEISLVNNELSSVGDMRADDDDCSDNNNNMTGAH